MRDAAEPPRRRFLQGSLLLGAAAVGSPVRAQGVAPAVQSSQAPAATPSAAAAHAEIGPIGTEPDVDPTRMQSGGDVIEHPGSDYMVDLMRAADIKYVSAMVGSTFRGLHESVVNHGGNTAPELIVCVHEEVSAALAHGYFKVAGAPMACMLHGTVGLQHASMAIYNAWCDRVPMMLVVGDGLDETKRRPGVEWLHTAQDLGAFVRAYVKWDESPVSLPQYGEDFMRAMQVCMTPPYGPVLLVADSELQENEVADPASLAAPRWLRCTRRRATRPASAGRPTSWFRRSIR